MSILQKHPLHHEIGKLLKVTFDNENGYNVLLDTACGGEQQLPLFVNNKSSETELCDVDAIILHNNQVKVIIEIEESENRPLYILGKYFAPVISNLFNDDSYDIKIQANSVLMIQVIKDNFATSSKKPQKFKLIQDMINNNPQGIIKQYQIFLLDINHLEGKNIDIINIINTFISKENPVLDDITSNMARPAKPLEQENMQQREYGKME